VASQPVAPQVVPIGEHAIVQQFPVPLRPHTPLVHSSLPPHAVPSLSSATQTPEGPGLWQKLVDEAQSASLAHALLHAVALAHARPFGHAAAGPTLHPPIASQAPAGVSMPLMHAAVAQLVALVG
jgi:hypothetical protein